MVVLLIIEFYGATNLYQCELYAHAIEEASRAILLRLVELH